MAHPRLTHRIITAWALLGGMMLLVVVAATALNTAGFTANFIARFWGGYVSGVPGYEDAVTLLIGVAALSMFPYCQLHGGHAAVDIVMNRAPRWANRAVETLSCALVIILALAMAVMLTRGMVEARSDGVETAVLGWPVWVFMGPAVVSCALWALAAFDQLRGPPVGS